MTNENYRKGVLFGIIGVILIGFQPIIALSRPAEIDMMIFVAMTCLIQALLFFPIMMMERKKIRSDYEEGLFAFNEKESLLYGYKKNIIFILFLGTIFAVANFLFFVAIELAGAINASLAAKTSIFFALLFGYLINKEKISSTQIIFIFLIFFGLLVAITQSFNLLEFNIGVGIMIISSALYVLAHSLTKPVFDRKELTPIFLVCVRNALSGIILISIYLFLFPIENINLIFKPVNFSFFFLMGAVSSIALFFYYLAMKYLDVSKSTILMSPTPIVTALFALMILGELFTIFHLIGAIIIIFSIIIIA
jgi:drug/metabolite transporter (DMT)-like permease